MYSVPMGTESMRIEPRSFCQAELGTFVLLAPLCPQTRVTNRN